MENFFTLSRTNNSSFMWFRRHRIGMFHKFRCKASKLRRGNRMWRNRTFCFDALDKIFGIFFIQLWSRFDFKRQGAPPFCLNNWLCLLSTKVQLDRRICQVFYRSKHSSPWLQSDRVKSGLAPQLTPISNFSCRIVFESPVPWGLRSCLLGRDDVDEWPKRSFRNVPEYPRGTFQRWKTGKGQSERKMPKNWQRRWMPIIRYFYNRLCFTLFLVCQKCWMKVPHGITG